MPPRSRHLPHSTERIALQRLISGQELPVKMLHPAGPPTIAKMVAKQWIEQLGTDHYRITPAGAAAMKAEIPTPSQAKKVVNETVGKSTFGTPE